MGNGANSRPENPVVMQPTARPVPQANGYSSSSGYVANGGETYGGRSGGRLQPHYGFHPQYTGDPAFRNGWGSQHSGSYDSDYYGNYGVNQNVERSIAPYSSSNSRSHHRKERHDRNYRDSSTSHQSALSSHHHSKRASTNGQYRNGYQRANKAERNPNPTSDEILFEVFHCVKTGRDYSVINVDGMRYLVDSWNTGTVVTSCLGESAARVGIYMYIPWLLKGAGAEGRVGQNSTLFTLIIRPFPFCLLTDILF